jgi:hypothetical protein
VNELRKGKTRLEDLQKYNAERRRKEIKGEKRRRVQRLEGN